MYNYPAHTSAPKSLSSRPKHRSPEWSHKALWLGFCMYPFPTCNAKWVDVQAYPTRFNRPHIIRTVQIIKRSLSILVLLPPLQVQIFSVPLSFQEAGIPQSVERLDDRGVGVLVPVGSRICSSPSRPDRLWGPPNRLSNGYRGLFPRV
jgi:hypothetical protein